MSEQEKVPFYRKNWFVILMLIFLFPIGLILMWANTDWKKPTKWIVTAIVLLFVFTAGSGDDDSETVANEEDDTKETVVESTDDAEPEGPTDEEIAEQEEKEQAEKEAEEQRLADEQEENVIEVNEVISFSEFTLTIRDIYIEDGDARIDMLFKNDSDPDGLRFISALGIDVYQGDTRLEETSGEVDSGMGGNSGIYYEHDRGIESPVDLSYGPINEDEPLRIILTPMLYDFEDSEEVTIELN